MKKFTSLFALLSCLCVVSAQAETVTVYIYTSNPTAQRLHWWDCEISGKTPNWDDSPLITSLGSTVGLFTKIEFINAGENGACFMLKEGNGNDQHTGDIKYVHGSENYYTYFSGTDFYSYNSAISNIANTITLQLAGSFTNWEINPLSFTYNSSSNYSTKFTQEFSISDDSDVTFKLIANGKWLGYDQSNLKPNNSDIYVTVDNSNGWITNSNDNFQLNHSSTGYHNYKMTAEWIPNNNKQWGWLLKIEGVQKDLVVEDGTEFSADNGYVASTATYSRNTGTNHWGTLCLPFEIKKTYTGVTFYELSSVSSTALTFTPISGTIAAGTPVAFKLTEPGTLTINESNVQVVADPLTSGTGLTMKGTFQQKTLSSIYLIYNDEVHPGTNITIPPYRAWFEGTIPSCSGAALRITVDDTEDLQFVEQEDGTVKAYYDLQGRKLDGARKGLVIENGKIIMVK